MAARETEYPIAVLALRASPSSHGEVAMPRLHHCMLVLVGSLLLGTCLVRGEDTKPDPTAKTPAEIERLIKQLGSDEFEQREAASKVGRGHRPGSSLLRGPHEGSLERRGLQSGRQAGGSRALTITQCACGGCPPKRSVPRVSQQVRATRRASRARAIAVRWLGRLGRWEQYSDNPAQGEKEVSERIALIHGQ